jgi:uncharacterized low-complexity protein
MKNIHTLSAVLASAFLASTAFGSQPQRAEFGITPLASGYQLAEQSAEKPAEGKCGATKEGKAHEGKCGAEHKDDATTDSKKTEGKAKEGKCGEGKCGANKKPHAG